MFIFEICSNIFEFFSNFVVVLMILVEKRLVDEVRKHDTLIIVGETGSGKTTRMALVIVSL